MNEGLFTAYDSLSEWKSLLERLNAPGCTAVYEIAEGERPFLAAALSRRTGRPVVLVSPTSLIAQRQAQDIERLTGLPCAALPAREAQFSRAAASRESTWQRLNVLDAVASGRIRVLCASVESLLWRCAPRKRFAGAAITLSEGDRYPPDRLIQTLLQNGYERVSMVEGQGQCAMRGSIVDVFAPNLSEAVRIEFFDDEVDSLRRFDCISQRSVSRVKSVRIAPATECLVDDPSAAADRLLSALQSQPAASERPAAEGDAALPQLDDFLSALDAMEATEDLLGSQPPSPAPAPDAAAKRRLDDVERVRAGQTIRTAPMWIELLCGQTSQAIEYAADPIVLVDRPDQFASRIRAARDEFDSAFEDARLRGDAFEAQRGGLLDYDDLLCDWAGRPVVILTDLQTTLGRLQPTQLLSFGSRPAMPYQSQLKPLAEDIASWKAQGLSVIILTGGEARGRRLQHALEEQGVSCSCAPSLDGNLITREVVLLPFTYSRGFLHPSAGLCLLSDADVFGNAYQRARKKQTAGERIASFTDLKVGDYVVHDLHGVGLYKGVVQLDNDGVRRDYLLVQYAGSDKLYVPADQFDRVTKYIGAEHAPPRLNRLGGAEWERQKSKVKAGLKKLAFDLAQLYARRAAATGYAFSHDNPWKQEFEDLFPYELTEDQEKCVAQIEADMESPRNMDRLLCGDVGYGKTEVALRAAFKAVVEGKQVAILAPTTILVQQHYTTIQKRFAGFPVKLDMLSRFRTPKEQKEILRRLSEGELDIVVGTHRLLAKDVKFHDLGLLVVDEEHRFGVNHKESIKNMKTRVDVLTLSATPIPRTLHMGMTGIRDMSVLETPPEERLPVKTYVTEYDDAVVREAIRREMARGGQVYFVYNRVRSIEQMHQRLQALAPEARIGVAHGQMRENALEDVMLDFYAGAYDVLLCTTIVESGLDVPEANTLIVFDADHFGLSQLYQIRGRVGRSNRQAYAYFTVRQNKILSETAQQRLTAIREFTEFGAGYRIALRDLEIRGAGDVLGPQQSGHLSTVGYDMYVKLIEQAVGEVRGEEQTPELDTRVELKVDAYLPEAYVPDEKLRVEIYKRIAMIQDEAGRLDIEEELVDRFGDVPDSVENLMRIAQLRGVTRKLGIHHLFLRQDGLHMRLDERFTPDPGLLLQAVSSTDPRLRFSLTKTPELVLAQAGLEPSDALVQAINVMTRVHDALNALRETPPESTQSS